MQTANQMTFRTERRTRRAAAFVDLLRGYRFEVCDTAAAVSEALAVRRRVYVDECGYSIAIPDAYDSRSWLLRAVDETTGVTVASLRVTSRDAGSLEAEEYFSLPETVRVPGAVEISRFSILQEQRSSARFFPVVALGMLKLAVNFVRHINAPFAVICSKPERIWSYQWIEFEPTGLRAPYVKLGNSEHELMLADLRSGYGRFRGHRHWNFFIEIESPQIVIPNRVPVLGLQPASQGPKLSLVRKG